MTYLTPYHDYYPLSDTSGAFTGWSSVNGGSISVIADTDPVSSALLNSLVLAIPRRARGDVGFANAVSFMIRNPSGSIHPCVVPAIKVDSSWTYNASFWYRFPSRINFRGQARLALRGSGGEVLGSTTVTLSGTQTTWKEVRTTIKPGRSASNTDNTFTVTLDGAQAAGLTVHFAMLSLFPPTFKNRPNGMRIDVSEVRVRVKNLNPMESLYQQFIGFA